MSSAAAALPGNSPDSSGSPKYKGVRKRKWGKWVSEIRLPNSRERIWLGSYDSPEKAARAFDAALFCLRGSTASFNFPDDPPDIPGGRSLTPAEIQAVASQYGNDVVAPAPDNNQQHHQHAASSGGGQEHVDQMDWSVLNSTLSTLDNNDGWYYYPSDNTNRDDNDDEAVDEQQICYDDFSRTSFLWNF